MRKLVVLSLGNGNLNDGFPTVTAQLWATDDSRLKMQFTGSLPAAPYLEELYRKWRVLWEALSQRFRNRSPLEMEEGDVTNVSEEELEEVCRLLREGINTWLNSEAPFRNIEQQLRTALSPSEEVKFLIQTSDDLVQRLPWHLWEFFEDYSRASVGLSAPEWRVNPRPVNTARQVRILAILGDSTGIDVQKDRQMLEGLPAAKVTFLEKPLRKELNEQLWGRGWDILFFAGHSKTEGETGRIYINETESLTVDKLKFALKKAIEGGLGLAIFNSCDGLGLARDLADLHLPQLIVMREPVPDFVAQEFLKYFLEEFAGVLHLQAGVVSCPQLGGDGGKPVIQVTISQTQDN